MLSIRCAVALVLPLFSLVAYADTPASHPTPNEPAVLVKSLNSTETNASPTPVTQNTQQLSELARLQAAGNQLQSALDALQQQSNQLQASLSTLNQQIEQSQLRKEPAQTPENAEQLQLLRTEYLQAQDTLMALRQQETLLQAHVIRLSQQLTQLPQTLGSESVANTAAAVTTATSTTTASTPSPVAVSPSSPTAPHDGHTVTTQKPKQTLAAKQETPAMQDIKTTVFSWIQDPALMLRVGGGFVALALLLLILLFWPKSARKKVDPYTVTSRNTPPIYQDKPFAAEENADLVPEYDFMGTEAALPTRLDLARGYIEMGKFVEARAAIKPVLIKGNETQKQEARCLLEKIELADTHI